MVLDLKEIINKYDMTVHDIIHVGGHFGAEASMYNKLFPDSHVMFFEPHPYTYEILKTNIDSYPQMIAVNTALGSRKGVMQMFVETANQGQSNSLLKPKHHAVQYPNIIFNDTIDVEVDILDAFIFDDTFNFMSIDVQGFELEVLKGAVNTLKNINYIITEVNNKELYEGCCMIEELDGFLKKFGFFRTEVSWIGQTWGDAFYIKEL